MPTVGKSGAPDYFWSAIYTKCNHEKQVAKRLETAGMTCCLPAKRVVRVWNNRQTVVIEVPIFPGYLFVYMRTVDRSTILNTKGIVALVEDEGGPVRIPHDEIEILRLSVKNYDVDPHPPVGVGRLARVVRGPLVGRQGVVLTQGKTRMVFSVQAIGQALAVYLNAGDFQPD